MRAGIRLWFEVRPPPRKIRADLLAKPEGLKVCYQGSTDRLTIAMRPFLGPHHSVRFARTRLIPAVWRRLDEVLVPQASGSARDRSDHAAPGPGGLAPGRPARDATTPSESRSAAPGRPPTSTRSSPAGAGPCSGMTGPACPGDRCPVPALPAPAGSLCPPPQPPRSSRPSISGASSPASSTFRRPWRTPLGTTRRSRTCPPSPRASSTLPDSWPDPRPPVRPDRLPVPRPDVPLRIELPPHETVTSLNGRSRSLVRGSSWSRDESSPTAARSRVPGPGNRATLTYLIGSELRGVLS